ncbi:MAG: hypothetical protein PUH99_05600 [Firmicutes bacterium]|nr:hypothetical protein [Bacillota bacterium]MDY5531371.1 hypothetical protein [Pumilibacteraceae bacterium]
MLIAIKDKGTVYIAQNVSDAIADVVEDDLVLDENVPIWKIKGSRHCYAACRSAFMSADVLRNRQDLFGGINTADDILTKTIPGIRAALKEKELIDKDQYWNNMLIIVKNDEIYQIDSFFVMNGIDDFVVCGRGSDFITGGLEWEKDLPLEERIKKVVACYDRMHCDHFFPIVLLNCKTGRRKILRDF